MNNAFTPNPMGARGPLRRSSTRHSALKIILALIASLVGLVLGLIVLLLIGSETGLTGMMVGMICATLPVPIYVLLVVWTDRYESEPIWMLATSFFWGALIAVFIAIVFNTSIVIMAATATNNAT